MLGEKYEQNYISRSDCSSSTIDSSLRAIHITTTPGTAFAGATYTSLSGVFGSSNTGMLLGAASGDLTGTGLLFLMFGADLTNLGGTVPQIASIVPYYGPLQQVTWLQPS